MGIRRARKSKSKPEPKPAQLPELAGLKKPYPHYMLVCEDGLPTLVNPYDLIGTREMVYTAAVRHDVRNDWECKCTTHRVVRYTAEPLSGKITRVTIHPK